jgi:hypothetical protein
MRVPLVFLTLTPALGMMRQVSTSAQVPAAVAPCRLSGFGSVDSTWHEVRGSGFTFRVPGSWRAQGHGQDALDPKDWTWAGPLGTRRSATVPAAAS